MLLNNCNRYNTRYIVVMYTSACLWSDVVEVLQKRFGVILAVSPVTGVVLHRNYLGTPVNIPKNGTVTEP